MINLQGLQMINEMTKSTREEAVAKLLQNMEATAAEMRDLIIAAPPEELVGYIYAQRLIGSMNNDDESNLQDTAHNPDNAINETQFLLEYVHAVLASDPPPESVQFEEEKCAKLFELSNHLREQAVFFAMGSSADTQNEQFGSATADIEFQVKSTWVLLRGNRHQVLEGEFYRYVLAPHDEVLKEVYGVGATEIAAGFQELTNATREGHANAIDELVRQFESAQAFASAQKKPLEDQ